MKILVRSAFTPFSGYGNDGIGMVLAFVAAGHDVYLQPTHLDSPLPPAVAMLLTKPLVAPFDLAVVHTDPMQLAVSAEMRRSATMVIAWSMWEYSSLGNMPEAERGSLYQRLEGFDALVAYDTVSAAAFAPYAEVAGVEVLVQQGGYDAPAWPEMPREWHDPDRFAFCMVGALHDRKDPFLAIQAFRELKDELGAEFEPAELHLKTMIAGLHPQMEAWTPKLRIHYDIWPTDVLRQFYGAMHVLLAPSRGEGKNMPALEMLSTGGTVIATNWGGHQQWLTDQVGYPLDYVLADEEGFPGVQSARASKTHLKALMTETFRHRSRAQEKGTFAASVIPVQCSWESVLDRLMLRVRQAPHGERVYLLSKMTIAPESQRLVHL